MEQISDQAQQILENIKTGIEKVPEGKLDYLMGFAEGLAAMADTSRSERTERNRPKGPALGAAETKEQKADAS